MDYSTYLKKYPSEDGRFGKYGGAYLPPQLVPAMEEITQAYLTICHSSQFIFAASFKVVPRPFITAKISAANSATAKFISSARI